MNEQFQMEVRYPGKPMRSFEIKLGVYTVGSDDGNKIVLPGHNISWRHAVLTLMADECYVEDLGSDTGVMVDNQRVQNRMRIFPDQEIGIGDYTLCFKHDVGVSPEEKPAAPKPAEPVKVKAVETRNQEHFSPKPSESELDEERAVKQQVQAELLERLDLKRLTMRQVQEDELRAKIRSRLEEIVGEIKGRLPNGLNSEKLVKDLYNEAVGLGPLEDLLEEEDITEIMVNGTNNVYIERKGKLFQTDKTFTTEDAVRAVIERIVSPIGRRIDESQPYVDARLPNGSRVNAIIPPLSLVGPCLTIRIFSKDPLTIENLCQFGSMTQEIGEFLNACVKVRKNIVVSGGTGSGKTTLLNVISNYLPHDERIITIEDAAELRLPQEHVVRLEARPANIEGRGAVTIRDLVRNALRMRPDRIVVGECRGGEAIDMLQAMNTGHEGSLTTVHANSPRDALARLETMVLMSGMELPLSAIREQIGSAVHIIVQLSRFSDGTRKINRVSEVVGIEGDRITMQDIFEYTQSGVDSDGKVIGKFQPTGAVPTFVNDMKTRGIKFDYSIFDKAQWSE